MKRIPVSLVHLLLCIAVFLLLPSVSLAAATSGQNQTQQVQAVQTLENTLFAVHYDQDSLDTRVSRLEETVFGQPQTGVAIDARISKLKSALSPSALGPLSPTAKNTATSNNGTGNANNRPAEDATSKPGTQPVSQTAKSKNAMPSKIASGNGSYYGGPTQNAPSTGGNGYSANPAPEPSETDYPTVSQMEQKLFSKTYVREDITLRLNRLEKEVFKTVQTGALSDRVDNLRLVVLGDMGTPQQQANNSMAYGGAPATGGYGSGYNAYPQSAYPPPANNNYGSPYGQGPQGYQPYGGNYGAVNSGYPQPPNYGNAYGDPYAGNGSNYGNYSGNNYSGTPIASSQPSSYNYGNGYPSSGGGAVSANGAPTPDMLAAISEVEKEVLGQTYPSEPLPSRLDRVETKVFHATSPEMSNEDRIQRVIAVSSAGGAPESRKTRTKNAFQTLLPIILTILPLVLL